MLSDGKAAVGNTQSYVGEADISATKAAHRLDASPGTIRSYIADGQLRRYKVRRLIKVDAHELKALVVTIDNS